MKRKPISTADAMEQAEREHDEEAEANEALAAADKDGEGDAEARFGKLPSVEVPKGFYEDDQAAAAVASATIPAGAVKPEDPTDLHTVKVRKTLPVKLREDEIAAKASEAMQLSDEVERLEDLKKIETQRYSDQIKTLRAQIRGLVRQHKTGEEMRAVDAVQVFDLTRERTWYAFRGERYDERAMDKHELKELKGSLFKDVVVPGQVDGPAAPVRNADELAKEAAAATNAGGKLPDALQVGKQTKPKRGKAKPAVTVQAVNGEGEAVDPGVAAVFKSETKKGGKRDHVSL